MKRSILTFVCTLLLCSAHAASYGILINSNRLVTAEESGASPEGYTQYLAHVQLNALDTIRLIDITSGGTWMVDLDAASVSGFDGSATLGYLVCNTAGCYDCYIKLQYGADQLYIGNGTEGCSEGVEYTGSGSSGSSNANYYLIGNSAEMGAWTLENAVPFTESNDLSLNLPAGEYAFKILQQSRTWEGAMGYSNVGVNCSSGNIATDADDNIYVTMSAAGTIYVSVSYGMVCVTGDFDATSSTVHITTSITPENSGGYIYRTPEYESYTRGTTIQLEAYTNTGGWMFDRWSDNDSWDNPRSINLDKDTSVTAIFSPGEYGILVNDSLLFRGTFTERLEGSYVAQFLANVQMNAGDYFQVINLFHSDNSRWRPQLEEGGLSGNFTSQDGSIRCNTTGCYDMYIKIHYGQSDDVIYIGEGADCPPGDAISINGGQSSERIYSVVGTENLFSVAWNTEDTTTNMQLTGDGMYVYTLDSVTLIPEGDYQYKVIANHAWNIEEYPSVEEDDNYHITVEESGVYSVLFSFQPGLGCNATTNYLHAVSNDTPAIIASGECAADGSSSVTWLLTGDSILTIGGYGAMADYNEETVIAPWYEYKDAYHSVYIASGVTNVGNLAFQQSANLRYVDLASTVISLGNYCFYNCPALHSLTLPESLTSVGDNTPFGGNTTITSAVYNSHVFVRLPQDYTGEYTVEPGTTIIASDAFKRCNMLTSVALPSSVTTLAGSSTFEECSALASVNIPDGVTTLGLYMFSGCSSLRFINLPASVTSIGSYCFGDCSSVDSLVCYATTPPEANGASFAGISETVPVYVPLASLEQYRAADGWSGFSNYHAIDDGSPTEPDVPEEYTLPLDTNWTFIMLPGVFGLNADDVTADGEIEWGIYNSEQRATGRTGWESSALAASLSASQAYIVRARNGSAILTIHVPEQAREKSATNLPLGYYEAGHEMNANWNFLGNPYPFAFDIMAALEAADIEAPISVWNGTGYTTYTPGIDAYVLEPFGAFFIQLPNGGPTIFPLSPEYITE